MDQDIVFKIATFLALIPLIAVHEFAHAWVADRLGDDTPRSQGRVTLDPMAHIDPIGTIAIPLITMFVLPSGMALLGWGKPVQVDRRNFERPRLDNALVALAGPAVNILFTIVVLLGMHFISPGSTFLAFALNLAIMSVYLAVFNMMPMPPLDGGHILWACMNFTEEAFFRAAQMGGFALLIMINVPFVREILTTVTLSVVALLAKCTGWGSLLGM